MTDFSKKENVVALMAKNRDLAIETRKECLRTGRNPILLVAHDYEMGMMLCEDGSTLRLVGLGGDCAKLLTFDSMVAAQRALGHWNRNLTPEQRAAGCELKARRLQDVLHMHAIKMDNLVMFLEKEGK